MGKAVLCSVCGREFIPAAANGKYCCRKCAEIGKGARRREWEQKTGYLEKKRIQQQERRKRIKAEAAERETVNKIVIQGYQAPVIRGNTSPEYWEEYKLRELKWAEESEKISKTTVNGIPVQEPLFGVLVCESIKTMGRILTKAEYEKKQ